MPQDETKHKTKHSSTSTIFARSTKCRGIQCTQKYCIISAIVQLIIYTLRFIAWQRNTHKKSSRNISKRVEHFFRPTFGNCIFQWRMMAINLILCRPNHFESGDFSNRTFLVRLWNVTYQMFRSICGQAVSLKGAWVNETVTHSLLIVSDFYFVLIDLPMDSLNTRLSHNRGIFEIHLPMVFAAPH